MREHRGEINYKNNNRTGRGRTLFNVINSIERKKIEEKDNTKRTSHCFQSKKKKKTTTTYTRFTDTHPLSQFE